MKTWNLLLLLLPMTQACSDSGVAAKDTGLPSSSSNASIRSAMTPSSTSTTPSSGSASDPWAPLRAACLDFTNEKRASEGTAALALWTEASACSDQQAQDDLEANSAHGHFKACGESAQNTCPGWTTQSDTEAQQQTLIGCLTAMWNEGPGEPYSAHGHYINMSNVNYTKMTCGFHFAEGELWINQNFK